jgi:protein-tyrosine phosphatase
MGFFGIFGKREHQNEITSDVLTDIHSHFIPGIDDGVKTVDEALSLIGDLSSMGYTKIITTPHIRGEVYDNTPEIIMNGLQHVKDAVEKAGLNISLDAAAEYFVDDRFMQMVSDKEPLMTLGSQKHLLIEFSHYNPPLNYKTILFDLQAQGYSVILAHPERYGYFHGNFDTYRDLYDRGVFLQLNLVSLTGFYDRSSKIMAEKIIEHGLYSFAGTDAHNEFYIRAVRKALGMKTYRMLREKCTLMNDMI